MFDYGTNDIRGRIAALRGDEVTATALARERIAHMRERVAFDVSAGGGLGEPTLPPENFGKCHCDGYNLAMAKQIADAIPLAWQDKEQDADFVTKYNNQTIAKHAGTGHERVSRYLGAFRAYGLTHVHGIALPPPLKHKSRQ